MHSQATRSWKATLPAFDEDPERRTFAKFEVSGEGRPVAVDPSPALDALPTGFLFVAWALY